jgi:hypothetical protein
MLILITACRICVALFTDKFVFLFYICNSWKTTRPICFYYRNPSKPYSSQLTTSLTRKDRSFNPFAFSMRTSRRWLTYWRPTHISQWNSRSRNRGISKNCCLKSRNVVSCIFHTSTFTSGLNATLLRTVACITKPVLSHWRGRRSITFAKFTFFHISDRFVP